MPAVSPQFPNTLLVMIEAGKPVRVMSGKRKGDVEEVYGHSRLRAAYFVLFPDQHLGRVDETSLELLPEEQAKN